MKKRLSDKQRRIYEVILQNYALCGHGPSMREIKDKAKISSTSVVSYHCAKLAQKGYLVKSQDDTARALIPSAIVDDIKESARLAIEKDSLTQPQRPNRPRLKKSHWRPVSKKYIEAYNQLTPHNPIECPIHGAQYPIQKRLVDGVEEYKCEWCQTSWQHVA